MKTVQLPTPHMVREGSDEVFLADEIKKALKEAGVEYVLESPEQARIRELEAKLRRAETVITEMNKRRVRDRYEARNRGSLEEHDQNAALRQILKARDNELRLLKDKNIELLERLEQEESRAKAREKDMNYWNSRATGWESRAKELGVRLEEEKKSAQEWQSKSNYWMGRLEDLLKEKAPRF